MAADSSSAAYGGVQLRSIGRPSHAKGDFDLQIKSLPADERSVDSSLSKEEQWKRLREIALQERLQAYGEDLAEWFAELFHMNITLESFPHDIENGVLLCKLARLIEVGEVKDKVRKYTTANRRGPCPPAPMDYSERPTAAFHMRDNVTRFITWCKQLGVAQSVIFEADDVVGHKNGKNVLYCLMELARIQGGVEPPRLIQMERLIDSGQVALGTEAEERNALQLIRNVLQRIRYHNDRVERVGPGRYDIADLGVLNIGILRSHVMVRLPNSWDTLEHYIMSNAGKKKPAEASTNGTSRSITLPSTPVTPRAAPVAAAAPPPSRASIVPTAERNEADELRRLLAERDRQLKELEEALRECSDAHDQVSDKAKKLEAERAQQAAKLRDHLQKMAELEGRLAMYKDSDKDKNEMLDHIDGLERQMAAKDEELSGCGREVEDLRGKLDEVQKELDDLQQQHIDERVRDAGEAAVRQKHLEDEMNRRIAELQKQLADMEADEKDHDEEMEDLRAELQSLLAKNAALAAKNKSMEEAAEALNDELQRLRNRIAELEEQLQQLAKKLARAEKEIADLRDQLEALQRELAKEKEKRKAAEDERDRLAKDLQDEAAKRKAAEGHAAGLEKELEDVKSERDDLMQELGDARATENANHREIDELGETAKRLKAELQIAQQEKQAEAEKRRQERGQLEEALQGTQHQLQGERDELESALEAEKKINEGLREKLKAAAGDLTRQQHQGQEAIDELKRACADLERRLADAQKRAAADIDDLKAQQAARDARNDAALKDAERAKEAARAEADALAKQLHAAKDALAKSQLENGDLRQQLGNVQQRLASDTDRSRKDLADALAANHDQAKKIRELEGLVQNGELREQALGTQLDEAVTHGDAMETAAKEEREKGDALAKQLRDALDKLQKQGNELQGLRDQADADQHALAAANGAIKDLSDRLRNLSDTTGKSQQHLNEEIGLLQQKLRTKDRLFSEMEQKNAEDMGRLQDQLAKGREAVAQLAAEKAAGEKAAAARSLADQERLKAAEARIAQLEEALRKSKESLGQQLADLENENAQLRKELERPPVVVDPAIINSNRDESELLSDPQVGVLSNLYDGVAEAAAKRQESLVPLQEAERRLEEAATACDRLPSTQNKAQLEAAKVAREKAARQFADDDWKLGQMAKRAVEDLRLLQLHDGKGPLEGQGGEMPEMGLASVDAVVRIAELERMLQDAELRGEDLSKKVADLVAAKQPERDDLLPYRENIADWLNALQGTPHLNEKNLMANLEDGKLLCAAANIIDQAEGRIRKEEAENNGHPRDPAFEVPPEVAATARVRELGRLPCRDDAERGSPEAVQNVGNFIGWARGVGIADPDVFTPPDLVERKDDWAVLVGLFDLARLTRGLPLPALVAQERAQALARSSVPLPVKNDPIDQVVTQVMSENPNFRVKRVGQGRYIFGQKVLLMRILHGTVMVRVGGGWEELRSYLLKHTSRAAKAGPTVSEADAAVEAIRQSAGGVGLHTTRTRVRGAFE